MTISILYTLSLTAFFNPTIKIQTSIFDSKTAVLHGNGPPVLFSTGLFSKATWRMYSNLINQLKNNVTIITLPDIDKYDIDRVADAIAVDKIGLMAHSSLNPEILSSSRLQGAVLIDPIKLPLIPDVTANSPVSIIKAGLLYQTLPEFNQINIHGATEYTYENVGHTDLLDDSWANIATSTGFWKTTFPEYGSFDAWQKISKEQNDILSKRQQYRRFLSEHIINFFCKQSERPPIIHLQ